MYSKNALQWTTDSERVWRELDSFWRSYTAPTTGDLVRLYTIAQALATANITEEAAFERHVQLIGDDLEGYRPLWYPLIIYRHLLNDRSYVTLDSGLLIDDPPEFLIGGPGDPQFDMLRPSMLRGISTGVDAVDRTSIVLGPASMELRNGRLVFAVDPFTLLPVRQDAQGNDYVLLWLRRPVFDNGALRDQVSWFLRYRERGRSFTDTLRPLYELIALGFSLARYQRGVAAALGLSFAREGETVIELTNDGYRQLVITDQSVHRAPLDSVPVVSVGQVLREGMPVTDQLRVVEGLPLLSLGSTVLPGLALQIPLSTGVIANLVFANLDSEWSYDPGRPSAWRFPIGGTPSEIEVFWTDVQQRNVSLGVDFETVYGLDPMVVNPVNPLHRIIEDLLQANVVVTSVRLSADLPTTGFFDRLLSVMPRAVLYVLQQSITGAHDTIDTSAFAEDVGAHYNAAADTETISVPGSGTDLTYTVLAPLVVIS